MLLSASRLSVCLVPVRNVPQSYNTDTKVAGVTCLMSNGQYVTIVCVILIYKKASIADRTARRQFQATGQPVSERRLVTQ